MKSGTHVLDVVRIRGIVLEVDLRHLAGGHLISCVRVSRALRCVSAAPTSRVRKVTSKKSERVTGAGLDEKGKEGKENAEWVLIDFIDVVAHVFNEKNRNEYNLEGLWGDDNEKSLN